MKNDIKLPDSLASMSGFKRKFSVWQIYRSFVYIPRAMSKLIKNNKSNLVNKNFIKRLQLVVTEVNGCPACSYQYTKMALRQGMSSKAIIFAQHFADSKGYPKKYAYDAIEKEYGQEQAEVILSAVQIMIAGNMYGVPFSAFQAKRNGQAYKDSSLFYELGMLIGGILILPIAFTHGGLRGLVGLSNKRLDKSAE